VIKLAVIKLAKTFISVVRMSECACYDVASSTLAKGVCHGDCYGRRRWSCRCGTTIGTLDENGPGGDATCS
jgi:hypothetical protein